MEDQIIIRQAKVEDAPRTRELLLKLLKSYPEAYLPTWEEEKKHDLDDEVAKLEKLNQRPTSRLFVAETEGNLVGMVVCHGHDKERIRHQATVERFGVLPEYGGRGIGTLLTEHLLNWVKDETEILRLDLWVILSNPRIIPFYEKFGFRKEAVIGKTCQVGGQFYDSVIMVKWFERGSVW